MTFMRIFTEYLCPARQKAEIACSGAYSFLMNALCGFEPPPTTQSVNLTLPSFFLLLPPSLCLSISTFLPPHSPSLSHLFCPSPRPACQQTMQEWMAVIDAAIQGVPEQAHRRRQTICHKFSSSRKVQGGSETLPRQTSAYLQREESLGSSLGVEALTLSSSRPPDNDGATFDPSEIHHEDLSDEELLEDLEDEMESGDEEGGEGEELGAGERRRARHEAATPDSHLSPDARLRLYENQRWRMEHWSELCRMAKTAKWKKVDTHDGVTLARSKFGRGTRGHAVIKVEGVLAADPATVYQFLQLTTREGGKLDYIFRNELLLDAIEEEPKASLIYNQFHPPLPRISRRDLVALKMWVPQFLTQSKESGFVMVSIDHPNAPEPQKDSRRMHIGPSGIILSPYPGPDGAVHTQAVILMQLAFFGALHRMLKGAYNSGLLKLGLRSTFTHISEQLQRFVELVNM
ncbi:hypothetical protein GBAR_LOCUS22576 [Geodia barretti]|uniref:START domain-containing protein n=1 Tax=Geodia barretti TaxID=519541 RepID=A0AA35X0A0_GEOBA|nr:hypothetical protein GBAR_LOCUS22576 [Geodia barretti]